MLLTKPKFIAIDSSILSEWSKDAYSSDGTRRKIANMVLNQISSKSWIIVITWHHFEELLRYSDDTAVENRMRFILNLPLVAWVWRADGLNEIGSVVDVLAAEVKTYLSTEPDIATKKFIFATKNCLLRFGIPSYLPTLNKWRELRSATMVLGKMQQKIASLIHATPDNNSNVPLSALRDKNPLSSEEQKQAYRNEISTLKEELATRGDKRILQDEKTAQNFCNDIFSNIAKISESKQTMDKAFVEQFGYFQDQLPEDITLGEFKDMVVRYKNLANSVKQLGLEIGSVWPRLKECRFPSGEIISEIRISRRNAPRASGSDLNDDYIASLIPYLDAVIIDKRIHGYLLQARKRNPWIFILTDSMLKANSYRCLPNLLSKIIMNKND
jgi:hypothetical protein